MTMPTTNGAAKPPKPAKAKLAAAESAKRTEPESYHGIEMLRLHVGDPVPTPPVPMWYVVEVHPDLARYLLSLNHPDNRKLRQRTVARYAGDMRNGHWLLTAEALSFSRSGVLQSGQHRLMAVTEYGAPVHLLISFGWPDEVINVIDRGVGRTNADALKIAAIPNHTTAASAVVRVVHYTQTVGTRRSWQGMPSPSSSTVMALIESEPEQWMLSVRQGSRAYDRLDHSFTKAIWSAAHYIIAASTREVGLADSFFDEVIEGTGAPRTATRQLADWARRRPASQSTSGDVREPIELIIRAFNAWRAGRTLQMVKQPGFELSRVRS